MSDFLLYASVVALFLVCILVVLVILMQRPSANAGMGSALGGGAAETVFGGESANVLSKMTTFLTVTLFVLSFGLYLGFVFIHEKEKKAKALTAEATAPIAAPAAPAAAAPAAAPAAAKAPAAATPTAPASAAAKPQSTPAPAATTPAKPAAPAPAK